MNTLWLIFLIALGACVGSFLNVVIYRLPRGESIVFPGSHCPSCGWAIRWYDNLPLLSWFVLGGRCRRCKCFISPRYVIVEAATAIRVGGLFACYYILRVRGGGPLHLPDAGDFIETWPMFAAHAGLLCGLLACALVDAEHFQIPLEVMWVCSIVGLLAAAGHPAPFFTPPPQDAKYITAAVSPSTIAVGLGAVAGLVVSLLLQKRGFIQPSFIDAEDAPPRPPPRGDKNTANKRTEEQGGALAASQSAPTNRTGTKAPLAHGVESASPSAPPPAKPQAAPRPLGLRTILHILVGTVTAAAIANIPGVRGTTEDSQNVAYSTEHGVRPRKEILWELLFLLPPILLASAASLLLGHVPAAAGAWNRLFDYHLHPQLAPHLEGLGSAIFGYVIGGLWVWATRILGTLAFNKEAMGMGDVHILAAVGAVTGWIVPSLTFFITPFIGLGWALYVWIGRKQSVIAYGPLLATGCLAVMLFYDPILRRIDLLLYAGH